MLKRAADPAEGFRAEGHVRGDITQGYLLYNMRGVFEEVFIAVGSCFEMGIHETFLEADIIFFIRDPDQSFDFVVLVQQFIQPFFGDAL